MIVKKRIIRFIIITFLIVIYSYTLAIEQIPDNIIIFEGETIKVNNILGFSLNLDGETIETSASSRKRINDVGKKKMKVNLFNSIFVKNMEVDVLPRSKVIPVGSIAGVKLYTSGILVVRHVRNRRSRQQKT